MIEFAIREVYKALFSWWLNPAIDRWIRKGFANEIGQAMPFLFNQYNGKVVADPKPKVNDPRMDYVCVASCTLVFKFARWHSENYEVQVAPKFAPVELYDLLDVLRLIDPAINTKLPLLDTNWRLLGQLLEPRFHLLETAFGQERFPDMKAKLARQR